MPVPAAIRDAPASLSAASREAAPIPPVTTMLTVP